MKYNNSYFTREATTGYDEGLRIYMLSIYRNMSMALGISALVAYIVGSSEQFSRDVIFYSSRLRGDVCSADLYLFFQS
jgi:FtsH-binding integral membrane protein